MPLTQKMEVALVFQKHQSTGHQKVVDEDIWQDKLQLMSSHFLSQNVILPLEN